MFFSHQFLSIVCVTYSLRFYTDSYIKIENYYTLSNTVLLQCSSLGNRQAAQYDIRVKDHPSSLVYSALERTLGYSLLCHFNFELHFSLDCSLAECRGPHTSTATHTEHTHTPVVHTSAAVDVLIQAGSNLADPLTFIL